MGRWYLSTELRTGRESSGHWVMKARGLGVECAEGHTLLETVVALALLVAVLVPAGAALGLLAARPGAGEKAEALQVAERALERTLADQRFQAQTWSVGEGRWQVERRVEAEGEVLMVHVLVYRRSQEEPRVELQTARFLP